MNDRVLVFRLGGLGDLLVSLPSLKLLREFHHGARFTLVCRENYGRLFQGAGLVDEVVSAESGFLTGLFVDDALPNSRLGAWLDGFGTVWGWTSREAGTRLGEALLRQGAWNVRFISPPPSPLTVPLFEHFFNGTAAAIGHSGVLAEEDPEFCRLRPAGSEGVGLQPEAAPSVVIHPGSGGPAKCWPLGRFLGVVEKLAAKGLGGFLVTGEAEERLEPSLGEFAFPQGWSWLRRPPLSLLAERLRSCRFYMGNDSGVTHLAAACGARVLALFNKEHEIIWRPCGRVMVLSAVEVNGISLEDVWSEIMRLEMCT